jgi:hypothetical protein
LLRDPRQKKEAWADLQIAMRELAGAQPPAVGLVRRFAPGCSMRAFVVLWVTWHSAVEDAQVIFYRLSVGGCKGD